MKKREQRFARPESMEAPRSPTDMIIALDGLSGATNAGRLEFVGGRGKNSGSLCEGKSQAWEGRTVVHFGSRSGRGLATLEVR